MLKKWLFLVFFCSFLFAALSNQTFSFQGKLLDATGAVVTGTKSMTFTLYPQMTSGTAVSNATWSQSVNVQNGIYFVELDASAVDLSNVNDAWMEVTVAGETLSPRIHLTASAFATKAKFADTAVTANTLKGVVNVSGNNVGVGTMSPGTSLDVRGVVSATDLILSNTNSIGSIHLFDSANMQQLWNSLAGERVIDVSAYVPAQAKGVVLKVIVVSATAGGSSSIVFADRNGAYAAISHYLQNGFTNYNQDWAGGIVIVPFLTGTKTFKWKMMNNNSTLETNTSSSNSYGGLIGWY